MHSTALAPAGKAVELESREDGEWITAKVVEPGAIKLTEEGVYSAFSIGISRPRIISDPVAKNGRIVGGVVTEVSLVDYPANPTCKFALTKAASVAVEDGEMVAEDWADVGEHELVDDVHKAEIAELTKTAPEPPAEDEETETPEAEAAEVEDEEPAVEDTIPAVQAVEPGAAPNPTEPVVQVLDSAPANLERASRVPELVKRVVEATVEKDGAGSAALAAVHSLLVEEITQDGGTGSECYEIEWLADLYTSLKIWVENDEWEDAWEEMFAELAAKPETVKTQTLLQEFAAARKAAEATPAVTEVDLTTETQPTVTPVEKGVDIAEIVKAAVAEATGPMLEEIAVLTKQVDELGAQPDPSEAPFRGGTGGTVPVNVTEEAEILKARKGEEEEAAAKKAADFRDFLVEMTKHPVPAMAMKARDELRELDTKAGIA